jgi:multidrug efflux pump
MGLLSMVRLPINQYPDLVPPSVSVSAVFPGASPDVISDLVAKPLEQALGGLPNLWYTLSTSSASGLMTLVVTFELGLDSETATTRVNQKVQSAMAELPEEVRRQGVTVSSGNGSLLQIVTLASTDGRYDSLFLNDYIVRNILDNLRRVNGIASVELLIPEERALRIWFDPARLAVAGLTAGDLVAAIREQNSQLAAGSFGLEPAPGGGGLTWLTNTGDRFDSPEQFADIIVRVGPEGQLARLGDLAQVTLGAADYSVRARLDGNPVAGVSVSLMTGANALDVADNVRAIMDEAAKNFPHSVEYAIPYDVTKFVKLSIEEVYHTLLEALVLVVLVIFAFLHRLKATLIPAVTVPISIVGAMVGLYALGFSINLLTLFALVLSIGIVVDDAIVVLENAERIHSYGDTTVKQAVNQAMAEVASPIIAIVLVLAAVFIPLSFVGGLTGEMFKQFGLTIALSVAISGLLALTLTPIMCVKLMGQDKKPGRVALFIENIFEWPFAKVTWLYLVLVQFFLKRIYLALVLVLVSFAALFFLFRAAPQGLVPEEDQGYLITMAQLPDGASMPRTDGVLNRISDRLGQNPNVETILTIAGLDLLGGTGSKGDTGVAFVILKDWDQRKTPDSSANALASAIFQENAQGAEGFVAAFNPPAIIGLGTVGGLAGYLMAPEGAKPEEIVLEAGKFARAVSENPVLLGLSPNLSISTPTVALELDIDKTKLMGVSPTDVYQTLAAGLSGVYVNDFVYEGRTYRVILQSDSKYREKPDDLDQYLVKSQNGSMVPLSVLIDRKISAGPFSLNRFNSRPAAGFSARAAEGRSNLEAIAAVEEVAAEVLPDGWGIGWSGSSFQEKVGGGTNYLALLLALGLVYLILAVQYENLILPLVVLFSTPFSLIGAIASVLLMGAENDVYVQVSMVTLLGLSVKNAILVVEFAYDEQKKGQDAFSSALEAAQKRFRPIVITSLAFILGSLPLFLATGAGAAARVALGGSVIGGMVLGTVAAPILVPAMYTFFMKNFQPKTSLPTETETA